MHKVVIFGSGAVARDTYIDLKYDSPHEVVAFTVDRDHIQEELLFDLPIVPFDDVRSMYPPETYKMIIAVGYVRLNRLRAERYCQAKEMGYELISCISSKAIIYPGVELGDNCIIWANTVIAASAKIGNNVVIACSSIIPHDVVIQDHCLLSAGVALSGHVTIEPYCFLGTGATVRNNVTIARECIIGAGAIILSDTQERGVYMGQASEPLPITSDKLSPR